MNTRRLVFACASTVAVVLATASSVAVGVSSAAPAHAGQQPRTNYRTVAGNWVSEGCQPSGAGSSRSSLTLLRRTSTLALSVYADRECKSKLFTLTVGSTYRLGGQSPAVEGARLARFSFNSRQVTPHAQPIADAMNQANCGRTTSQVNFATDVFNTGCAPVGQQSKRACPVEYELLKRAGNRLFLGERPADGQGLCSPDRQATKLGVGLIVN